MQNHLNEIAQIIETTRMHEEGFLPDSMGAAIKIVDYIQYHFETKEKITKLAIENANKPG